ncbi:MAG TPA: hypothetical protein VEW46_23520 [Pyrinomonadaceae bacterium]|nr:hypothetical protein [Pyrinomonadaceae bacterium]
MMKPVHNSRLFFAAATLLFLVCAGQAATKQGPQKQGRLNAEEQKVINYLVADWGEDYSVTSVDIAMAALKMKPSEESRFRIGNHIKAHPELHEIIRRWGWVTLVLTPDEKLIARTLINAERDGKPQPTVSDIAKAVGITEAQTDRGLSMLERYEVVQRAASKGAGYKVVPRYIKWEPRLDFIFHKVSLDSGRQFNTN